ILISSLLRVEVLDVADRHGVDQRALLLVSMGLEADRLLNGGVRVWRFLSGHRRVQVRPPGPRLAPITNRASGISLPGFAKCTDGLWFGKGVHHLKTLVEEGLGFTIR